MLTSNHLTTETATYWNLLKNVSNEVKLRLITLLSQSVSDSTPMYHVIVDKKNTRDFLSKYSGAWKGDDSAEEIISSINAGRNSKNPVSFD